MITKKTAPHDTIYLHPDTGRNINMCIFKNIDGLIHILIYISNANLIIDRQITIQPFVLSQSLKLINEDCTINRFQGFSEYHGLLDPCIQ
ncbi:hypothetical protein D3C80_793560 [compost metagenome]